MLMMSLPKDRIVNGKVGITLADCGVFPVKTMIDAINYWQRQGTPVPVYEEVDTGVFGPLLGHLENANVSGSGGWADFKPAKRGITCRVSL